MSHNDIGPKTVPCLMATAINTVSICDRKLEQLKPTQVRIKTERSMVSTGTELHRIQNTHTVTKPFPTMTGYIALGTIVGLGAEVTRWKLGDRVLFRAAHFAMIDVEADSCTAVPAAVSSADAVCTVLLGISIRGVRGGKVSLGKSVAVFGLGVIGQFATHLAKLAGGCPVIAIDPVPARREIAHRMGADVTLDPFKENVPERLRALTDGQGVDVAIESTATPRVVASLPELTAFEGTLVILGGVHGKVDMDLYTHVQKRNQTIVGCGSPYHGDYPFDNDDANHAAILRMMAAGMIRPNPVITHQAPYTQGPELYRMLMEEKDKAVGVQFTWEGNW